jgi:hypothetical protein
MNRVFARVATIEEIGPSVLPANGCNVSAHLLGIMVGSPTIVVTPDSKRRLTVPAARHRRAMTSGKAKRHPRVLARLAHSRTRVPLPT